MTTSRPLELEATAEAQAVGPLRRQVRRWLVEVLDVDTADDMVLAVSEALENVVDHAYAAATQPGTVTVRADDNGQQVTVSVTDAGRWRPVSAQDARSSRGRGLSLIDQLSGRCQVTTGSTGTVVTLEQCH